jgi:hypothetical protein
MQTITTSQQFPVVASFLDSGNSAGASYRGAANWTGPSCVSINPDPGFLVSGQPDDAHRIIKGVAPGSGSINVTVDGGTGSTTNFITGTLQVEVDADLVVSITLAPGAVGPKT